MAAAQLGNGRPFWKMTGSGNDFVFLDSRAFADATDPLETPELVSAMCRQHLGIGADGVVFLGDSDDARFAMRYYNADGSRGELCGNASLCAAQLAVRIGLASHGSTFHVISDSGMMVARVDDAGIASVRLAPVMHLEVAGAEPLEPAERRLGFARVGVPHVVVLVDDVDSADVEARGRVLRYGPARAPAGANVNFVSPGEGGEAWRIRTYERGVEAETYACGTGAVASAACLQAWNLAPVGPVRLTTASGRVLTVRLPDDVSDAWSELSGEGRVVFEGVIRDLG